MDLKRSSNIEEILSNFPEEMKENSRMVRAMAEICLIFRREEVDQASKALGNYLEWRKELFGSLDDHCLVRDEKLRAQLQCNFLHMSPMRLNNGEGLVYISMKDHDPSIYTTNDTIKCMHYFLITAMMQDPTLAESGFVIVNNMADVELHHLDMHFPGAIASAVGHAIPIRVATVVIVDPPILLRFIVPIVKSVLPAKLCDRLHVVTDLEILSDLISANSQVCLPVELGGTVEFSTNEDMKRLHAKKWTV
jgi:hypothetical protein